MIGFRQFFEAASPEHKRRAEIISRFGDLHFNVFYNGSDGYGHSYAESSNRDHIQVLVISKDKLLGQLSNSSSFDEMVQNSVAGSALFEKNINPTNIHIGLFDQFHGIGIGGMLYEVALELATKNGQGVMMSGAIGDGHSSADSYRIWDYFFKSRTNIIPIPFSDFAQNHKIVLRGGDWSGSDEHLDDTEIAANLLYNIEVPWNGADKLSLDEINREKYKLFDDIVKKIEELNPEYGENEALNVAKIIKRSIDSGNYDIDFIISFNSHNFNLDDVVIIMFHRYKELQDKLGDAMNSLKDERTKYENLRPEDIKQLKSQFPAAFNVYQRNPYTIPQLEKANKITYFDNIKDLRNYLMGGMARRKNNLVGNV
jgi:hypothetical protein